MIHVELLVLGILEYSSIRKVNIDINHIHLHADAS